ncbi:hypothetical protein Goklo_011969 [Gossypium klotzschianum]|uniref:Uncharacterized protein n=1 Tax=Gossypium klotzschianum TaxID=34286 RepID=A0A7J8VAQ4_9ROSI|nr:hypothetical protein [Gossypium klotzschianum]
MLVHISLRSLEVIRCQTCHETSYI